MFCVVVMQVFELIYLRVPNQQIQLLMEHNTMRGFLEMFESIGFMHWEWKNCPFAWKWMYRGHVGACSVMLEADYELLI
jgi:hypothetical protein